MSSLQLVLLWLHGRVFRNRAARWNLKYATGHLEKLKIPAEQARVAATARLLTRHGPPAQVLEIGCGEALLQQQLARADFQAWVGIDISEVAIQRAQAFASSQVRYHVADMELFDPGGRFDVIVFTESIYFSADPRRLLERYVRFLNPSGHFIVSIFRTKRSDRIWAGLHTVATPIDSISTTNELGTWDCKVLVPVGSPKAGWGPSGASDQNVRELATRRPGDLVTGLLEFWTPEGYQDRRGFHFGAGPLGPVGCPA